VYDQTVGHWFAISTNYNCLNKRFSGSERKLNLCASSKYSTYLIDIEKEFYMDKKLELAIQTIFDSLTTVWEDNGNIMADAVRDSVITNLAELTGLTFEEIESRVDKMIEKAQ